jgi:hypothetical protein
MTIATIESPHNGRRSPDRPRTHPSVARDLTLLHPSAMLRIGDCTALKTQLERPRSRPTAVFNAGLPDPGATNAIQCP